MSATEPQRLGERRLSWAEAEQQLLAGCKPVIEMALAAGMTGKPLDRTRLRLQLVGLLRVLTSCADNEPRGTTTAHEPHAMPAHDADGVKNENANP